MNLLLTLGHNSSAIWTDGATVIGYEEERLTRKKSDSTFPVNAIKEIAKHVKPVMATDIINVYVSHWFDCSAETFDKWSAGVADIPDVVKKYWPDNALDIIEDAFGTNARLAKVVDLTFTHHDAHAWAAVEFYRQHATTNVYSGQKIHIIVCDGFGTHQEVFSIYTIDPLTGRWNPTKLVTYRGYKRSLGLLYQYATSFCGMKENQDEYKFLGYESKILKVCSEGDIDLITDLADELANKMFEQVSPHTCSSNGYINLEELQQAKSFFNDTFTEVIRRLSKEANATRPIIGFFIQRVIERFYSMIIRKYGIQNCIVTGGVHYNVKLNNHVAVQLDGQFCAVPLAGDQGAAIGVYAADGFRFPFNNLFWGRRGLNLESIRPLDRVANLNKTLGEKSQIIYTTSRTQYVSQIVRLLREGAIVNTITGAMEFGPRALCHTSTLAWPTEDNVNVINELNGRNTVMPFAPVMTEAVANSLFSPDSLKSIVGSHRFMIVTLDYEVGVTDFVGVAHKYPLINRFSGRPQVIPPSDPEPIKDILDVLGGGPLINTSLNVHGRPIVFSLDDALADFEENVKMAEKLGLQAPSLVIGDF